MVLAWVAVVRCVGRRERHIFVNCSVKIILLNTERVLYSSRCTGEGIPSSANDQFFLILTHNTFHFGGEPLQFLVFLITKVKIFHNAVVVWHRERDRRNCCGDVNVVSSVALSPFRAQARQTVHLLHWCLPFRLSSLKGSKYFLY